MKKQIHFRTAIAATLRTITFVVIILFLPLGQIFSQGPGTWIGINAQDKANPKWTVKGEERVFIENKGQYDAISASQTNILFSARTGGKEIYFTHTGVTYRGRESYFSEEFKAEIEAEYKSGKEVPGEEIRENMQYKPLYLSMEWVGANQQPNIKLENLQSFYYNFPTSDGKNTYKAGCYKKVIYQNIYPNIDIEYILPEKGGIKYSLIVRPGGDLSQVKIKYAGAKNIAKDKNGNILIDSEMGTYTDHAPVSFYGGDNSPVGSSFVLNDNNEITFHAEYDKNKTLVVDPWVISYSPWPTSGWTGLDVDYDNSGNVYVYGFHTMIGTNLSVYGSFTPDRAIKKYSPAGALLWVTANAPPDPINYEDSYGDFCLDKQTGNSYIGQFWVVNTIGPTMVKLDASGAVVTTVQLPVAETEIDRMKFDQCKKQVVCAGGGMNTTGQRAQMYLLDANLNPVGQPVDLTGIATINEGHDIGLFDLDPQGGACYVHFVKSVMNSNPNAVWNNRTAKCPMPAFMPLQWAVSNNLSLTEGQFPCSGNLFTVPMSGLWPVPVNGFNGMAAGMCYLYAYNGIQLEKLDKSSGAILGSVSTSGKLLWHGGLELDRAENIYAGAAGGTIQVFDKNLNLINTIALPDTGIRDLKVDTANNLIYASGFNFLTAISVNLPNPPPVFPQFNISSTPASCSNNGTASVTSTFPPATCVNQVMNFSYNWMPGNQTTSSIAGLGPGSYTVHVSIFQGNTCNNFVKDTFLTVTVGGGTNSLSTNITSTNAGCVGNGTASASVTGGSSPYTYLWNNGQTTSTATGLSAGSYTVTITDASGCTATNTVSITQPQITAAVSSDPSGTVCVGAQVFVSASGGTTYSWNTGATTANIVVAPTVTTAYVVTVTDANGCTGTATLTVPVDTNCTATGISQFNDASHQITIWPNPSGGKFTIKDSGSGIYNLDLYNVMGEKVYSEKIHNPQPVLSGAESSQILNLDLPDGIYYLRVNPDPSTGSGGTKLIINKK